jgi:uncharacterized membrane-anchored protein YitT (DUF2179 family)
MLPVKKIDVWQELVTKLTVILIYACLYSLALNLFWQPGNIYAGGLTGIAQILATVLDKSALEVPLSVIYYLLNIPMFLLAWFKINRKFVLYTVICVTIASVAIHIIPSVTLTTDPIICAIFGGAINGFSLGLALKYGLSTGGMDALILTIRQSTGRSIGVISIILNGLIVLIAGYLFGWPYAFYSVLSIFVSGKVTDLVYVKHKKVQVTIITQNPNKVIPALQEKLSRGMTIIPYALGAYKQETQTVLLLVITTYEMEMLDQIMKTVDPKAFVSVAQDIRILSQFEELDIV